MADNKITVPTYEQIVTILSKLATNYSNLASVFYQVFYDVTPADVTFQMYDESGVLQTYTIPNRAKDFRNFVEGEGSPEGSVDASLGVIYQDLANGVAYIKETPDGSEGWAEFISRDMLESIIIVGDGSPEGLVEGGLGLIYVDRTNVALYIKGTETGSIGWVLISASTSVLAKVDLSNLSSAGASVVKGLANQAISESSVIAEKQNVSDKVTVINGLSTDEQYPSAKATYSLVSGNLDQKADLGLSNINSDGELKFINWSYVKEGIIVAPNGLIKNEADEIIVPQGMKLLGANGLISNSTKYNNLLMEVGTEISEPMTGRAEGNWIFFVEVLDSMQPSVVSPRCCLKENFYVQNSEPSTPVDNGSYVWFNPETYEYKDWLNSEWTLVPMTRVGEFTINSLGSVSSITPRKVMEVVTSEHVVIEVGGDDVCWYRLYKDGWLEQGGCQTGNSAITLQKSFSGTNYTFVPSASVTAYTKAVGSVTITAGASAQVDWMASGWSA